MTDTETIIHKTLDRIYDEQFNLILTRYGEETAGEANYGWGVASDKNAISVATKVYGIGVLVSEWKPLHPVSHRWEPYETAEQTAVRLRRLHEEQKAKAAQ